MAEKTGVAKRRQEIRLEHWPNLSLWTGEREVGWFSSPRSLPLILGLLGTKLISGNRNPAMVYLELLSRQRGEGVIEMAHEQDHAFAAGYVGNRAVRTWQERMNLLQELGFIATVKVGNQRYRYVAIVHPTDVVERLRLAKRVPNDWWNAYTANKRETKERTFEQREQRRLAAQKVVPLPAKSVKAKERKRASG